MSFHRLATWTITTKPTRGPNAASRRRARPLERRSSWRSASEGRRIVVPAYVQPPRTPAPKKRLLAHVPDKVTGANAPGTAVEEPGERAAKRFPLKGNEVVLCEAKVSLTPGLIGQALVYKQFALRAGALVRETVVFAEAGARSLREVVQELGLTVVILPLA